MSGGKRNWENFKLVFHGDFWTVTGRISTALFTTLLLVSFLSVGLAWLGRAYPLTSLISSFYDIHAFNHDRSKYFETLVWLLIITSVQFYNYYRHTMQLYDSINVSESTTGIRTIHHLLQFIVFTVTFWTGLIIATAVFENLLGFKILNEENVDILEINSQYLPYLKLIWLIPCFVVLDLFLLFVNFNFSRCKECCANLKVELKGERREAWFSIVVGSGLTVFQSVYYFSKKTSNNPYHINNNLEVLEQDYVPLIMIAGIQLLYLAFSLKDKYMPVMKSSIEEVLTKELYSDNNQ